MSILCVLFWTTYLAQEFLHDHLDCKDSGATSDLMAGIADYLVWYAKDKDHVKYRQLYSDKGDGEGGVGYRYLLMPDGTC